ncbi:MAG: elongation factor P hydroxylase [Oceanospirillaceae bacterium]|nr:elongation factor P hydroxylase [Oceanospirillaceae bacterium]
MLQHTPCQCQKIITLFDELFAHSHHTKLVCALCDGRYGEADEPVYEPANAVRSYHQLVFAHGYFSSALHEISHWCVAGSARRLLEDFGYWYQPDGRSALEQAEFEKVEIKPQAIEWLLSLASNTVFVASADNLSGEKCDDLAFRLLLSAQARRYLAHGLPTRAALLLSKLQQTYGGQVTIEKLYWPEEAYKCDLSNAVISSTEAP